MTSPTTNVENLLKNRGNFIFNYKLGKFQHLSDTPAKRYLKWKENIINQEHRINRF